MDDRKVKGTMLVDHVRLIRTFKDRSWDEHLTDEDWKIVNSLIIDAAWYPLDLYRHLGLATFNVLAEGNVDIARMRGQVRGKELFLGVYKDIVVENNPVESLRRFTSRYDFLFNFSSLSIEVPDENQVKIHHDYSPEDLSNIPYCYQLMGHLDALVEMAGKSSFTIEITDKQWEGSPTTVFDIRWE